MQRRLFAPLALLALAPLAVACSDGGTATQGTTTPGAAESAFDDYFAFGTGERAANDATGGSSQEACAQDENCTSDPNDPQFPEYVPPVCELPLAPPAGALAACQEFCGKVSGCVGQTEAAGPCAADCAASLAGTELAAVEQIFGCFASASCADIAAWGGASGGSSVDPGDPREEVPPTDAAGPDEGGDPAPEPADGEAPVPPREGGGEGGGEVIVVANPIGECVEALFASWVEATLPAAKQAVCDAVPANEERCGDDVGVGVEVSDGEAQPSGSSADSDDAGGSDGSNPSEEAQAPREDPVPPDEGEWEDDHDDEVAACHAYGALLSAQTFARIGACDALTDCTARDACLEQIRVCAPFIEILYFGGGRADVTTDVSDPEPRSGEGSAPSSGGAADPDPQ